MEKRTSKLAILVSRERWTNRFVCTNGILNHPSLVKSHTFMSFYSEPIKKSLFILTLLRQTNVFQLFFINRFPIEHLSYFLLCQNHIPAMFYTALWWLLRKFLPAIQNLKRCYTFRQRIIVISYSRLLETNVKDTKL